MSFLSVYPLSTHFASLFYYLPLTQGSIVVIFFSEVSEPWTCAKMWYDPPVRGKTDQKIRLLLQKKNSHCCFLSLSIMLCRFGKIVCSCSLKSGGTRRWAQQQPWGKSLRPPFGSSLQLEKVPEGNHKDGLILTWACVNFTNFPLLTGRSRLSRCDSLLLKTGFLQNIIVAAHIKSAAVAACESSGQWGCIFWRLWQSTFHCYRVHKALWRFQTHARWDPMHGKSLARVASYSIDKQTHNFQTSIQH